MLLEQDLSFLCSQFYGIVVVDSVPLFAGFAPYELKGSILQEVVTRLLDGGLITPIVDLLNSMTSAEKLHPIS